MERVGHHAGGDAPVIAIVACLRWEHDAVVEWLAFHHLQGVNRFFLYCNDDDPEALLEVLDPSPVPAAIVTLYHVETVGVQRQCYCHFLDHHAAECDWAIFLDLDEFINVRSHPGIAAFLADIPADVGSVCLHWFLFGPNGVAERGPRSVLETYTRRAAAPNPHVKNFFRPKLLPALTAETLTGWPFWHSWADRFGPGFVSIDALGRDISRYYEDFPNWAASALSPWVGTSLLQRAHVSHYFLKSLADPHFRVARSRSHDFWNQAAWSDLAGEGALAGLIAELDAVEDLSLAEVSRRELAPRRGHAQPGYGRIALAELHPGQHRPRIDPPGAIMFTGTLEGPIVVLQDGTHASVAHRLKGEAQVILVGTPPIWQFTLDAPVVVSAIACFLAPDFRWAADATVIIDVDGDREFFRGRLFGLHASLTPLLWTNRTGRAVRVISVGALRSDHLPIDQVRLLA